MMALAHYNSLIKAHPAVTAALGSVNTRSHMGNQIPFNTHGGEKNTKKKHGEMTVSPYKS